ncbi:MAG TPA: DUF222 domain-containing protein, partial [Naasia sp.]
MGDRPVDPRGHRGEPPRPGPHPGRVDPDYVSRLRGGPHLRAARDHPGRRRRTARAGRHCRERRALPYAEKLTATKFARKVEHLGEMIRPSEATERHREAVKERELYVQPAPNGMAWVHALMRSIHAAAIDDYVDKLAKAGEGEDDDRTHIERRLDSFVDLVLDKGVILPPTEGEEGLRQRQPSGIVPTVHVVVPALTLTGMSDEPATLDGIGPIDPETARE